MKDDVMVVIPPEDYKNALGNLKESLRNAREAYGNLKKNPDLLGLPRPEKVTIEWLTKFIDNRVSAIMDNTIFTVEQSTRYADRWRKVGEKVKNDVKTVQNFIIRYKNDFFYDEESGLQFQDIEKLAVSFASLDVPRKCTEHIYYIGELRASLKALRKWEKENGVRKIQLDSLLQTSEEGINTAWAKGTILIDRQAESGKDGNLIRYWREAAEQNIV